MVGCEACSERSSWSRWQPGLGKRGSCYRRLNETAMGYVKGSIDLSSMQDGLLLEQVLRSRHATHDQLWQFFQLTARENRRRIFNWRMLRLVQHGLVTRLNVKYAKQGWVYAISESGASYLAGNGDGAALVASKAFKRELPASVCNGESAQGDMSHPGPRAAR